MKLAVYSTKQYDKKYLQQVNEAFGFELEFFDFLLTEKTAKTANGCEAVCIFVNDDGSRPVLEELKKHGVKYIALRCAGFNNVDLDAAKELGLQVVRVPAYSPEAVAEHAIGMMMTLNRRIHRAYQRTRDANFSLEGLTGFTMHGKTAGVIGTGKIGVAALRILKGFGMRLLAFDPYPSTAALDLGVEYVDLQTLFAESDVISLHCPLTPENYHLLNHAAFDQMKNGVMVINTSRGALIDSQAAIEALKNQKIGSLGMDVYENERDLPEIERSKLERIDIRTSQLITPLFEYSGACSGCGETPYIKLLTQLYGDRMLIANATGCSSIYGGNLPSTPYTTDANGRGPAWANSLFEDNAEFGLGFRLSVDQHRARVMRLLAQFADRIPAELNDALHAEATPDVRREQVAALRQHLKSVAGAEELLKDADALVEKSIWLIGGDGWAYDIGFGGLDHVLSLTENVNILVLDTQCYSNTGGQASKATPLGAVTKFGEHGKRKARKDLGVSMMMYGHVYVAQISLGAQLNQTVKAIQEAEAWPGPSLIIAYSPCEEHGYDLALSHDQMRQLTATGFWPLYRFDPRRADEGKPPLALDSRPPSDALAETLLNEQRFRRLNAQQPEVAEQLWRDAALDLQKRYDFLALLAGKAEKPGAD
ncbi:hypothetical protein OW326_000114 [Salmonella enterica]|nr:hypothetical protein [Salmonella enterica]